MLRLYQQLKNLYHFLQAHFWRLVYGRPDVGMHVYGVTGTNGKTTTCHIVASILQQQVGEEHVGMLTTIAIWLGKQRTVNETKMTTLPSSTVFHYLRTMRTAGVTHVVLEMTSHALDQHRLAGLRLDGAIMLNIAREHLDYHRTMDQYAYAKGKIMNYLKLKSPLVVKGDDEWVMRAIASRIKHQESRKTKLLQFTSREASAITATLPGDANKENTLAATLLARAAGVSEGTIQRGVKALTHVTGRMEWVELPTKTRALIDYAVTPDALERLYKSVRETVTGKVYAVLGAAGLRDRGKRPDMARVVAQYADELVITREDPWTESEEQIFTDLERGLTNVATPWRRIVDRKEALAYLIAKLKPGDVVVTTGKGAETGMGIGKEVVPWNEKAIILEIAHNLKD